MGHHAYDAGNDVQKGCQCSTAESPNTDTPLYHTTLIHGD